MSADEAFWKTEVRRRIHGAPVTRAEEAGIVDEIAQDLQQRFEALLQQGVDDAAAREGVLAGLDAGEGLSDQLTRLQAHRWPILSAQSEKGAVGDSILQDCRFAVRAFARRPLFMAVAVLAIAIGVAGLTTLFSLVN